MGCLKDPCIFRRQRSAPIGSALSFLVRARICSGLYPDAREKADESRGSTPHDLDYSYSFVAVLARARPIEILPRLMNRMLQGEVSVPVDELDSPGCLRE